MRGQGDCTLDPYHEFPSPSAPGLQLCAVMTPETHTEKNRQVQRRQRLSTAQIEQI